jgi:signal transduction histidine kinase
LTELCQRYRNQYELDVSLTVHGLRTRLAPDTELVLYRIAQEALTNVAKHSQANTVNVDLKLADSGVSLTIRDDGAGFDSARYSRGDGVGLGLGLFGMEERASLLGGELSIKSERGRGTEVFAIVPLLKRRPAS